MRRTGAAAAADDVEKTAARPLGDLLGHLFRCFIVATEGIGQTGVGMGAHRALGDARHLLHILAQLFRAEGAVEAERDRLGVTQRVVERLGHLSSKSAARRIGNRSGDHHRQTAAGLLEIGLDREDRRLGVEGVEDGFDKQDVGAALHQPFGGFQVGLDQLIEGDGAVTRIVHIGRNVGGAGGGAEHARDEAWLVVALLEFIGHFTCQACTRHVHLVGQRLHAVVGLGDGVGAEGVGLDDIGAGLEIGSVDLAHDPWLGQHQQVVIALQIRGPCLEAFATILRLARLVSLDHGAGGAVEDQDTLLEKGKELGAAGASVVVVHRGEVPVDWEQAILPCALVGN
jgi:hypothetical protein